jgi:phospholipase A1
VSDQPLIDAGSEDPNLQDTDIKFQFSFKVPLWDDIAGSRNSLFAAYTQLSMWQAYNADESSPFRDTNYEPEFFVFSEMDVDVLGLKNRGIRWGAVHQSNGRGNEELSRSWNRLYADFLFERGNFALSIKPWYRIPEDEEEDNNPDLEDYLGYGEVRMAYKLGSQQLATMLRNNLDFDSGENHGAIQLDWTFPLTKWIKGYVQYWNGYGESLLNYQYSDERIGVGFLLSDWL